MKDARVARVLGKRVDVLRDVEDRSTAAQASRKIRNRRMRGIGLRILPFPDPFVPRRKSCGFLFASSESKALVVCQLL